MKSRSRHVPLANISLEGPARPTVIPPQKRSLSAVIGVVTLILLLGASVVVIGSPNTVLLMARAVGVR